MPEGWDRSPAAGDGGNPEDPTAAPCRAYHWHGAERGRFINIIEGASPYGMAPEATADITVLGRPAIIGPVHEGYAVEFSTYAPQATYTLVG